MQFNDTTNKNGLIQRFEKWTRMQDGEVTGTLLKQVTADINSAFDQIMPRLLSYTDKIRWDDTNHTDRPSGTIDIVSSQNDYTVTEDDNSLDILNIVGIRILTSATETEYQSLERMKLDDERVHDAISPNATVTGTPTHFLEQGNTIFFYPNFNYSVSAGIQLFFEREQSYFVSTDTTKEPGIPKPFRELLALIAAHDWVAVNRTDDTNLLTILSNKITQIETALDNMIALRNPVQARLAPAIHPTR